MWKMKTLIALKSKDLVSFNMYHFIPVVNKDQIEQLQLNLKKF